MVLCYLDPPFHSNRFYKQLYLLLLFLSLAGCGRGSGSTTAPTTATLTAYFSFNLPDILVPSVPLVTNTDSTNLEYYSLVYHPTTQTYTAFTLTVAGHFSIPAASLQISSFAGTTGAITGLQEAVDGHPLFYVSELNIDASQFVNAYASGNSPLVWSLVADGATSTDGISDNPPSTIYCGPNATGSTIVLGSSSSAVSIQQFLLSCVP